MWNVAVSGVVGIWFVEGWSLMVSWSKMMMLLSSFIFLLLSLVLLVLGGFVSSSLSVDESDSDDKSESDESVSI
jgi:hypothetical protein